jgi:hypothetical protein
VRSSAIALVVAVGIGASVASGSSSGDSSGGDSGSSTPDSSPDGTTPGLNTPVRDGQFEFVVSKVECGVETVGADFLEEEAQGQFCLATMTVSNIGSEAQTFDASAQKGITDTGATVDADGTASIAANEDGQSFLEKINPGNQISVVVVYDIAKDQSLIELELHDSFLSNGVLVNVTS